MVSQFKVMLQNVKKGSSSINEYLSKLNNAVDRLAPVGHSISDADYIRATFSGLPQEYYTFVISVNSRSEGYMVEEIASLLLAQEQEKNTLRNMPRIQVQQS